MLRLTPAEFRLLSYVTQPDPDLSRDGLAKAGGTSPNNLSALIGKLKRRGLITVERGLFNRITKIDASLKPKRIVNCVVGYAPRVKS